MFNIFKKKQVVEVETKAITFEESIRDCISTELNNGIIERVLTKKLEESISESVNEMFRWNGVVKKSIEEKLKETLVPVIEEYDYSELIPKIDTIMTEIIKTVASDQRDIFENFKSLCINDTPKDINLSDIYKKWIEYCEEAIDKDDIEDFDCEGGYINCSFRAEEVSNSWSDMKKNIVSFECEEDSELNIEFELYKWTNSCLDKGEDKFSIRYDKVYEITSLKNLNEFEIFMMKLNQSRVDVIFDEECSSDEVFVEYQE